MVTSACKNETRFICSFNNTTGGVVFFCGGGGVHGLGWRLYAGVRDATALAYVHNNKYTRSPPKDGGGKHQSTTTLLLSYVAVFSTTSYILVGCSYGRVVGGGNRLL